MKEAGGEAMRGNRGRGKNPNHPCHISSEGAGLILLDEGRAEARKATQTEPPPPWEQQLDGERRRTLSLGDFLPEELRAGIEGLDYYQLPPDEEDEKEEEDDDWELLDTPGLDELDFDTAAAKQ